MGQDPIQNSARIGTNVTPALRLPYTPPLDWEALLRFLGPRAIPGVEEVEGDVYRRTIAARRRVGILEVHPAPRAHALLMRLHRIGGGADTFDAGDLRMRARRLFDLDADPRKIRRHLGRDPILGPRLRAHPGLRLPGAWDLFETTVRAILGQQVSVKGATTLSGRVVRLLGKPLKRRIDPESRLTHLFPPPAIVAGADLTRIGLPVSRARAIQAMARGILEGRVSLEPPADLDLALEGLCALPGIGPWTANYMAMRVFKHPDAFPSGDLGLVKAMGLRPAALERRAEAWRPWRAYAAVCLWQSL
jgi:AraC family transcriptional regulator of adaptative response / DNA-3-methyladenine glycosylase II